MPFYTGVCSCCSFYPGEKQSHTRGFASPSSRSVLFPASARGSGSPQQGAPPGAWTVPQANAQEQTQAQENGTADEQCQDLVCSYGACVLVSR